MLNVEGHAIVSTDGMIADAEGAYPMALRNDADWRQYQAALDRSALVVIGRRGHERHPNPGRRRLVLTRAVAALAADANDANATFWNPAGLAFHDALSELGIARGTVAITGVFDLFLPLYTSFVLSERHDLLLPGGTPCFAAGHPRTVLPAAKLHPAGVDIIDPEAMVTTTLWRRESTGMSAADKPAAR
jgi:hypothetical protein